MKVLLVNPPHAFSPENPLGGAGLCLPPLGLLSVAAYLRAAVPGLALRVLDCPASGLSVEALEREAAAFAPDLAGFSVHTGTFTASLAAAAAVKKAAPSCYTVAGGHHASVRPVQCLKGFDAAVVGEGEKTFAELAKRLAGGSPPGGLPGLVRSPADPPSRPEPLDIDALPFPARDLVDLSAYRPSLFAYSRLPVTSMVTSRGCPYACGFCSKSVFGSSLRAQSAGRVLAEMRYLAENRGVREITFQDDTFTADRERVLRLCALLREARLGLTWSCMTRVDLVDPELLGAMRAAGCFSVAFGVDGADDSACGLMGKGFDAARAAGAVRAARAAGLETRAYFILGYPGETRETMEAAPDRIRAVDADHIFIAFAHPFFDTPLYREAKARGLLAVSDEELLDAHDNSVPLVNVPGMTLEEQAAVARRAYLRHYLRPASLARRLSTPRGLADSGRALLKFARWGR